MGVKHGGNQAYRENRKFFKDVTYISSGGATITN